MIDFFQTVADYVKDEDIEKGSLYPPLSKIREVSLEIATRIAKYAYEKGKILILSLLNYAPLF